MTSVTTRRHLLGSLGAFAASAFVPSAQATSDQRTRVIDIADIMQTRTLGSGQAAMRVTALGLGCMGMSHHRSETPDKSMLKPLIALASIFLTPPRSMDASALKTKNLWAKQFLPLRIVFRSPPNSALFLTKMKKRSKGNSTAARKTSVAFAKSH